MKENCEVAEMENWIVYAISCLTGKIYSIDLRTMEQRVKEMIYSSTELSDIKYRNVLKESEAYYGQAQETAYLNLHVLIHVVKDFVVKGENKEKCGGRIYQSMKECLGE